METLKTQYGLTIQHVPYKGTPAALTDLLGGNIEIQSAAEQGSRFTLVIPC